MKQAVLMFLLAIALACVGAAQSATETNSYPPVKIINGPVVETVSANGAVIAWSTNVNSGTMLRYGTDAGKLDRSASMPWGGITHRVTLKDLQPGTKYFFQAESGAGQGTGTSAKTEVKCFVTRAGAGNAASPGDCTSEAASSPEQKSSPASPPDAR